MVSNEFTKVTDDDWIHQNPAHKEIKKSTKRDGPYSKIKREKIIDKIASWYIDFNYSARQIAKITDSNRNTVNRYIKSLNLEIVKGIGSENLNFRIFKQMQSFELQKTRLREDLDNTKERKEKREIEKLLLKNDSTHMQFLIKIRASDQELPKQAEVEVSEDEIKELVRGMVLKNKYSKDKTNVYSENEIKFELIRKTKCDEQYAGIVLNKMLYLGLGLCGQSRTNQEYLDDNYSPKYDLEKFAIERNYISTEKSNKIRKKRINIHDESKEVEKEKNDLPSS